MNPEVREAQKCRVTPISIDIQESAVVSTMMQLEFQCFQTDHSETDDTVSCKQQLRWVGGFHSTNRYYTNNLALTSYSACSLEF